MGDSIENQIICIDPRFCGPPSSGNGGYVCGRLASHVDGCALVRLVTPPPLDIPLQIRRTTQGVELLNGSQLVAKAMPHCLEIAVPTAPTLEQSREISRHYPGFDHHPFSTCFVCGPDRLEGDGLRIFPGVWADAGLVTCPWLPDPSLADPQGHLFDWAVWSALDCPGGWAFLHASDGPALLGEFSVLIESPIAAGQELIVAGWETSRSGRKHQTGSALYTSDGRVLARGRATWIEFDPPQV